MLRKVTHSFNTDKPPTAKPLLLIEPNQNEKKNQNTILFVSVLFSLSLVNLLPSLVNLVHQQPNIKDQVRAQSVRSSQDRNSHTNYGENLATVRHLASSICPSWSFLLRPKYNLTRPNPGLTSSTYVIAHHARSNRAFSLASVYSWSNEFVNQLPIWSIFSQQSIIPTFVLINRVSCDRQL
jgi:hypothetical protein